MFFFTSNILSRFFSKNPSFLLLFIALYPSVHGDLLALGKIKNPENVRVLLTRQTAAVSFEITGDVQLFAGGVKRAEVRKKNIANIRVAGNRLLVNIAGNEFSDTSFTFLPKTEESSFKLNNRVYSGTFSLFVRDKASLLINTIGFNSYLESVLSAELGKLEFASITSFLEAFAVVVRTYTLLRIASPRDGYDVESSTVDQLYLGINTLPAYAEAVGKTDRKVLYCDDGLAPVFYHTACGGMTESYANIYGGKSFAHLSPVSDGMPPACTEYRGFMWVDSISIADIIDNLNAQKYVKNDAADSIEAIRIESRFPSGRVNKLLITFGSGDTVSVFSNKIRSILTRKKNRILRSTLFEFIPLSESDSGDYVIVKGRGNGHGVGLCQWGAMKMSKENSTAEEILSHYFPGTVERIIDEE